MNKKNLTQAFDDLLALSGRQQRYGTRVAHLKSHFTTTTTTTKIKPPREHTIIFQMHLKKKKNHTGHSGFRV